MIVRDLDDRGIIQDSGFGTYCDTIATGEAIWDRQFKKKLNRKKILYFVDHDPDWRRDNERRVRTRLGYQESPHKVWHEFLDKGPHGLMHWQDQPIFVMKKYLAESVFARFYEDYDTALPNINVPFERI